MEGGYGKETGYQIMKEVCHGMKFERDGATSEEKAAIPGIEKPVRRQTGIYLYYK